MSTEPKSRAPAGSGDDAEVSITLGADGRLYCHDITPQLLPVLEAVCGATEALLRRRRAGATAEESES